MPMHTRTRSSPPTPCRTPGIPNPAFPLYSQRCGTMTGDGGGISPLSPSYRDGCTLQPPAQCDATGTVPPSPTTALPVFFHCLHTPNPLFFANPKSGPIPPGDCIRSQTPPPKKNINLWEFTPPPSKPLRLRGGGVGWGCRGREGAAVPLPLACLLPLLPPPLHCSEVTAVPEPPPCRGRPVPGPPEPAPPLLPSSAKSAPPPPPQHPFSHGNRLR